MPAVAAAVSAAFSAVVGVFTGATTVAAAASSVAAIGSAAVVGSVTVSQAYTALTAISTIYAATRKPKIDSGGSMLDFKADPNAYNTFMLGRTAVGGNVVFGTTHGDSNNFLTFGTVYSCAGPIDAYEQFYADTTAVSFSGSQGQAATGVYADRMWQARFLGGIQSTALNITQNDNKWSPIRYSPLLSTWWTGAHKISGKAHTLWTMHVDPKIYSGVPKPTMVGRGIRVYDIRKDSSRGGSGTQRADDPGTWAYSANPFVHATTFLLGYYEQDEDGQWVRVGGCGLSPDEIDWPSFIEGMNVADANGWKVSGNIHAGMNKWAVLASILQAGGGIPLHKGALVSCSVLAPKVSVATITDADLLVQGVTDVGSLQRENFNAGIPRIRSEAAFWQVASLGVKTNSTYELEDGTREVKEVSFDLVAGGADAATQAGQLTAYAVAENRETIQATVTLGPKFADLRAGAAVTLNTPSLGLSGYKMLVMKRRFDPRRFMWTFTLRSETDAKHAWALGQSTVEPSTPTLNDNSGFAVPAPGAGEWSVSAPSVGPDRLPYIRVTLNPALDGTPSDRNAISLIIDYRPVNADNSPAGAWASGEYPINDVIDHPVSRPGRFEVKLRYRYPRNQQDPSVTTTPVYVTTSSMVVSSVAPYSRSYLDGLRAQLDEAVRGFEADTSVEDRTDDTETLTRDLVDVIGTVNPVTRRFLMRTLHTDLDIIGSRTLSDLLDATNEGLDLNGDVRRPLPGTVRIASGIPSNTDVSDAFDIFQVSLEDGSVVPQTFQGRGAFASLNAIGWGSSYLTDVPLPLTDGRVGLALEAGGALTSSTVTSTGLALQSGVDSAVTLLAGDISDLDDAVSSFGSDLSTLEGVVNGITIAPDGTMSGGRGSVTLSGLGLASNLLALTGTEQIDNSTLQTALEDGTIRPLRLEQGASVKLGGSVSELVQSRIYVKRAGDGETVSYGVEYEVPPLVIPYGNDGLIAYQNPGDVHETTPVDVTTTHFTGRARLKNPGSGGTPTTRTDDGDVDASGTPGTAEQIKYRSKELAGVAGDGGYLATFEVRTRTPTIGVPPEVELASPRSMVVGFFGRRVYDGTWTLLGQTTIGSDPTTAAPVTSEHQIEGFVNWSTWDQIAGSDEGSYEYKLEVISGYLENTMALLEFISVVWVESVGATGATDVTALPSGGKMNYLVIPQSPGSLGAPGE